MPSIALLYVFLSQLEYTQVTLLYKFLSQLE